MSIKSNVGSHWPKKLKERLIRLWFFKATGTALFLVLFFQVYFALLHLVGVTAIVMPTTWLDDAIVFWPPAFYIYASLWVYTALAPALQPTFKALVGYGLGIASVCLTGLSFFYFLPTKVPFSAVEMSTESSLAILRKIDMSGNACPSLHVATALFTCMYLHRLLKNVRTPKWLQTGNWIWCALIVYSTMSIKQHVVWDVVAGLGLGGIFGLIYPYFERYWLNVAKSADLGA
jgi:membrane-associated phospholipid phosphatase